MQRYKSGCVCEDGRESVRKSRSILRRIRGGREYGSGSGSVIRERRKRNGIWLKTIQSGRFACAQASALKLTPHSIPLSLSNRLFQVTAATSPPAQKAPQIGPRFSTFNQPEVPTAKCRISNGMRGELYQQNRIFSPAGDFLSLPVERKLRLAREVPPFALPSKSCICPGSLRLEQNQKTAKRLFENLSERVYG